MKTFNDCFYNSANGKGFVETFETIDVEKLTELIGVHTIDDVKYYDLRLKSAIGFLPISPMLSSVFGQTFSTLDERQGDSIRLFLLLRYNGLIKVKSALATEISIDNGIVKVENKDTETKTETKVSAFNSGDLENDRETDYSTDSDNTTTETKMDTETTVRNIGILGEFYKQSMFDKIMEYVKDLFTLQVVD